MATKSKSTRAAKAQSRRPTECTQAERLAIILKHYEQHASPVPSNPLVARNAPPEALKECILLVEHLYMDAHRARDGRYAIYLMLYGALSNISDQLEPLFDAARQVAKEARS